MLLRTAQAGGSIHESIDKSSYGYDPNDGHEAEKTSTFGVIFFFFGHDAVVWVLKYCDPNQRTLVKYYKPDDSDNKIQILICSHSVHFNFCSLGQGRHLNAGSSGFMSIE